MDREYERQQLIKQFRRSSKLYKVLSILSLILALPVAYFAVQTFLNDLLPGILLIALDCGLFMGAIIFSGYKNSSLESLSALEDGWDAYEELLEERKEAAARNREMRQREQEEIIRKQNEEKERKAAAAHPICPMCGSKNTRRISNVNRSVSVGMLGLASSKIGKQYECLTCKNKW